MTRTWLQHALHCISEAEIAEYYGDEFERSVLLEAKDYAILQMMNWIPFDPIDPDEVSSLLGYDGGWGTNTDMSRQ